MCHEVLGKERGEIGKADTAFVAIEHGDRAAAGVDLHRPDARTVGVEPGAAGLRRKALLIGHLLDSRLGARIVANVAQRFRSTICRRRGLTRLEGPPQLAGVRRRFKVDGEVLAARCSDQFGEDCVGLRRIGDGDDGDAELSQERTGLVLATAEGLVRAGFSAFNRVRQSVAVSAGKLSRPETRRSEPERLIVRPALRASVRTLAGVRGAAGRRGERRRRGRRGRSSNKSSVMSVLLPSAACMCAYVLQQRLKAMTR